MGFFEEYKRLEKLCSEIMNDKRGVSAYIEEMEKTYRGPFCVAGWESDLKNLKHYRWVRNQIGHNPACTEANMCNESDARWIRDFHLRIMNQTDPLARYRQATKPKTSTSTQQKKTTTSVVRAEDVYLMWEDRPVRRRSGGCLSWIACLLMVIAISIIL